MSTAGITVKPDVAVILTAKNLTLFLVNESGLPESKSERRFYRTGLFQYLVGQYHLSLLSVTTTVVNSPATRLVMILVLEAPG